MSMLKSANTESTSITGDYVMDSVSEAPFNTQADKNNNVHKHCKKISSAAKKLTPTLCQLLDTTHNKIRGQILKESSELTRNKNIADEFLHNRTNILGQLPIVLGYYDVLFIEMTYLNGS